MIGETIWLVMKVTQAAIPVAWRMTEAEANGARDALTKDHTKKDQGYFAHFFVMPCTNEAT